MERWIEVYKAVDQYVVDIALLRGRIRDGSVRFRLLPDGAGGEVLSVSETDLAAHFLAKPTRTENKWTAYGVAAAAGAAGNLISDGVEVIGGMVKSVLDAASQASKTSRDDPDGVSRTILVWADDDPDFLDEARARFDRWRERAGQAFMSCGDSDAITRTIARDTAESDKLVLFLDLMWDGELAGLRWLRNFRAHPDSRHWPIVIVSNSHDPAHIQEAFELGASAYVDKETLFEDWEGHFRYWLTQARLPERGGFGANKSVQEIVS